MQNYTKVFFRIVFVHASKMIASRWLLLLFIYSFIQTKLYKDSVLYYYYYYYAFVVTWRHLVDKPTKLLFNIESQKIKELVCIDDKRFN